MLTKSMAQASGPIGLRVNAVPLGLIEVEDNRVFPNYTPFTSEPENPWAR